MRSKNTTGTSQEQAEYAQAADLIQRARGRGMVVYRRLAGITRKDVELRTWLEIRGRSKDEALAQQLWEHRKAAIQILEREALAKVKTKFVQLAAADQPDGTILYVMFTPAELGHLEFQKHRFATRSALDLPTVAA